MTWTITKTCGICEHYPYHEHCIGCKWDEVKGENTKWELKKNPIVIERAVLDKIRSEIEALIEWHDCPIEYDNGNDAWYCEACNQAIKIIDKYKAESEKE